MGIFKKWLKIREYKDKLINIINLWEIMVKKLLVFMGEKVEDLSERW